VGALGLFTSLALLVVAPVAMKVASGYIPLFAEQAYQYETARLVLAGLVLFFCLIAFHRWLPAGRRRWRTIFPGVLTTMFGFVISSAAFGYYLKEFAYYADTYGGLAGVMIGLFYMYVLAAIFIFGAEINAAVIARRKERAQHRPAVQPAQ
jgi:membrane protein